MKKKGINVVWLPLEALIIDPEIQRRAIPTRLRVLTKSFDENRLEILTVSLRSDGRYYVVNGQHRVLAARASGHQHIQVQCHVYRDLTRAEEAQKFLSLNDARAVSAVDKFQVGLVAGEEACIAIDGILRDFGLWVGTGHREGTVSCPDRLFKIYGRGGEALLRETLATVINSWGTRYTSTEQIILAGLSQVLARYNGELDRKALTLKLSKYKGGPGGLIADSRAYADIKHISKTRAVSEIVVDAYNKSRRAGTLPPL